MAINAFSLPAPTKKAPAFSRSCTDSYGANDGDTPC